MTRTHAAGGIRTGSVREGEGTGVGAAVGPSVGVEVAAAEIVAGGVTWSVRAVAAGCLAIRGGVSGAVCRVMGAGTGSGAVLPRPGTRDFSETHVKG